MKRTFFDNPEILDSLPIIDTYIDLPYGPEFKNLTLKYLCLDHGFVLNGAHQALQDVFACQYLLSQYDFESVVKSALSPIVTFHCFTSYSDTATREALVGLKFRWNRENTRWEKKARRAHIDLIRQTYEGPIFIDGILFEGPKPFDQMELPF